MRTAAEFNAANGETRSHEIKSLLLDVRDGLVTVDDAHARLRGMLVATARTAFAAGRMPPSIKMDETFRAALEKL